MHALELNPNHTWKAAPGCRILIVDGGAVRFDFPAACTVISTPKYVCVIDRYPPHDRSLIAVSWRRVPINALGIPLVPLVNEAAQAEVRPVVRRSQAHSVLRPAVEAAWVEMLVH